MKVFVRHTEGGQKVHLVLIWEVAKLVKTSKAYSLTLDFFCLQCWQAAATPIRGRFCNEVRDLRGKYSWLSGRLSIEGAEANG